MIALLIPTMLAAAGYSLVYLLLGGGLGGAYALLVRSALPEGEVAQRRQQSGGAGRLRQGQGERPAGGVAIRQTSCRVTRSRMITWNGESSSLLAEVAILWPSGLNTTSQAEPLWWISTRPSVSSL